jgi:hypothetical protein
MIQTYLLPSATNNSGSKWVAPELANLKDINKSRYAFQFMYNPGKVTMGYAGSPAVDIGLELSGRDKIPLIGSAASSSTISFEIPITRMADMAFLDANTISVDAANVSSDTSGSNRIITPGSTRIIDPKFDWKGLYGTYSMEELEAIRTRGTMYDVEFLLSTLIGYRLDSSLRGFRTSDIGYLGAYPVELHLGKSLRYLVTIESFTLVHSIFTVDMIPVVTNLMITCKRLPDFNSNLKSTGAK